MDERQPDRDGEGETLHGGEHGQEEAERDPSLWVDRHGDVLFHYALIRVRDRDLAEDLVQETFLSALGSMETFRGGSSVRTWLIGILKHKIVDHYRRSAGIFAESELAGEEEESGVFGRMGIWGSEHRPAAWTESPAKILENRELYRAFLDCLDGLTPALRRVFSMREIDGMETPEICKVLNITATNLWVMLHRSRIKLRKCLEENWFRGRGS